MAGAAIVFLSCSIWRHRTVNSIAWDLGMYDQVVYLLSRGLPPVSSFLQFHFLGDHVSLAVYPLALLYRIYPTVFWLFGVQTLCLVASGAFTWKLARLHGLDSPTSRANCARSLISD